MAASETSQMVEVRPQLYWNSGLQAHGRIHEVRYSPCTYIIASHQYAWLPVVLLGPGQSRQPLRRRGRESRWSHGPHGLLVTPLQLWAAGKDERESLSLRGRRELAMLTQSWSTTQLYSVLGSTVVQNAICRRKTIFLNSYGRVVTCWAYCLSITFSFVIFPVCASRPPYCLGNCGRAYVT